MRCDPTNTRSYPAHAGYPVLRSFSIDHRRLWNTRSSAFADDEQPSMASRSRRMSCASFVPTPNPSLQERAQGKPGAHRTHSLARKQKSARASSPQVRRNNPTCPAQWFTAYSALSSATGLSCHRRLQIATRRLDASVGASGPHGFAVRINAARLASPKRPPHPAPNVRDDREAPLSESARHRRENR